MRTSFRLLLPVIALLLAILLQGPTPAKGAGGWKQYAVLYYDMDYYYVGPEVTDKSLGVQYLCLSVQGAYCVVNTVWTPDSQGRIPIAWGFPTFGNAMFVSME